MSVIVTFFYPEIKKLVRANECKNIKNKPLSFDPNIFDHSDEKRYEGENDFYICSLIHQGSIVEFVSYVTRANISLESEVKHSIFESKMSKKSNEKKKTILFILFFEFKKLKYWTKIRRGHITLENF